jgi:hypothetical protein
MLIQVIRSDNQYDYIQDYILDSLIETKKIVKFKRSTGWVTIGTHQTRAHKREGAARNSDRIVVNDDVFVREYRRANS